MPREHVVLEAIEHNFRGSIREFHMHVWLIPALSDFHGFLATNITVDIVLGVGAVH